MAYAQTNYSQLQGKTVNGVRPRYSIHDIGCFITAFCNLLQRFGTNIAPDQMDNQLAAKNLYIDVDDGVYDDVGWSTITAYDPRVSIVTTGNGAPSSDNSIVKFVYYSSRLGTNTTHFSLVHSAAQGLIIDSWDGQIKSWNVYGGPKAYATYTITTPQPVVTTQGVEMIVNEDQARDAYALLRGSRDAVSAGELSQTINKRSWAGFAVDARGELAQRNANIANLSKGISDRDKIIADLRTALTNEQNKPAKEVIKEVEKIVEKPVEVVKVETKYVQDQETKNMITSIFNYFAGQFKTFQKYIKK